MAQNRTTRAGSRGAAASRDRTSPAQKTLSDFEPDDSFRAIIDTIPILAWTARPDGAGDFFNRQWLEYTGLSLREALDWAWAAAIHPDDRNTVLDRWRGVIASGEPYEIEARMRRFDGEYRWFLVRADAMCDRSGNDSRWYCANTEIAGHRLAEEAVRTSEENLRRIVDTIPGLIFTTTPAGEVEFVSRPLLDYFCRTVSELQAWKVSDAVHPDDLAHTIAAVSRGVESGQPYEFEQRLRRADGVYRCFRYRAVPWNDAQGRAMRWYGLLTDIDDLKRAEDALRATQARLARATHSAALSELSASIAHEINQPLAAVVANGHACRRWLSGDPPNVERALLSTDRIIRDGNAAADVIQRIRSLFRHTAPRKDALDVNEVIAEVLKLMGDDLQARNVALKTELQPDLPRVPADRVQLQQVIANLARNGIEAMDGVMSRPKSLSIASRHGADEITVLVTDQGVGIDDAQVVFESFYTTKSGGMGMGLTICRSIIEAHGGRLWATQNTPHGATFGFALRIATEEST